MAVPQSPKHQQFSAAMTCRQGAPIPLSSLPFHLYTIWLFTLTDLKTIAFPATAFGILTSLGSSMSGITSVPPPLILQRLPSVFVWTWVNLLLFNISNQRQTGAVIEDQINKPWRPLPSRRLTPEQALNLQLVIHLLAFILSQHIGGTPQCLLLVVLEYVYNDLDDGKRSCITRNALNAAGFAAYNFGALAVALKDNNPPAVLYQWLLLTGAVVASTGHSQDLADQAGDRMRGRKTIPLVVGDGVARWTIAVPVALWTVIAPWFWSLGFGAYLAPVVIGWTLIVRTLIIRDVDGDKTSFRIWNLWMVSLYMLPLIKAYTWVGH